MDPRYEGFPDGFFARADESPDELFYAPPRLVTHIDDGAIEAVGALYDELGLSGDVLEVGAWQGGSAWPLAKLVEASGSGKRVLLLDFYEELARTISDESGKPITPLVVNKRSKWSARGYSSAC